MIPHARDVIVVGSLALIGYKSNQRNSRDSRDVDSQRHAETIHIRGWYNNNYYNTRKQCTSGGGGEGVTSRGH